MIFSYILIYFIYILYIFINKEQKEEKIAKMTTDYEYRIKKKDDEVNELKKKIDDMSNEFASMLRVLSYKILLYFISFINV